MKLNYLLSLSIIMLSLGCTSLFSPSKIKGGDPEITFPALLRDPEKYKGKKTILGGKILNIKYAEGKSWIEVLHLPLDWRRKPKETDESAGRFLAFFSDFRDPTIYSPGRKITLIGWAAGQKILLIGEKEYAYPVLEIQEADLWPEEPKRWLFFHLGIGLGGTF